MRSINPATGDVLESFEEWEEGKVASTLHDVDRAFQSWRETSFGERAALMKKAAEVLRGNVEEYGRIMSTEMGKPIVQARAEVEKCAWVCEYYAEHAEGFLADEIIETDADRSYVRFAPLGTVLAVMPWNFPFWQVFRFAAPALMAGNTGVLKHSSNVPGCALSIEKVFREAGFPENVFRSLLIGPSRVEAVIESPFVRAVTLTGSSAAGSKVAMQAGRVLKKSVLELGGSDPFIVLADADLEEAAGIGVNARCLNSGQSCIAAKRFIVVDSVLDDFLSRFRKNMEALVVGDPLGDATQVGPQAREDLMRDLHDQVERSVAQGAMLITGGKPLERPGYFYPPTLVSNVKPGMPVFDEELFGPVAAVISVADEEEAVMRANQTCYGLGASIWTKDPVRGERLARRIEAGAVFINGMVASDPRLPFGGIKASGYGRELSRYGIKEFVNIQTVWVK
ncbi:MAG: NAD-dependent succinate-semialdehyde dehydrogenase [Deltaproteobacteria bacterium]|nr:NAD-dependent succinate-semialdehyde dehydrogenase [Deltaproteobacteria bacterium]